jgi:beta-lactamase class D
MNNFFLKTYSNFIVIAILFLGYGCSSSNVKIDNSLQTIFTQNNATGSFGFFNNAQGNFIVYNLKGFKDSAYCPAQTFNVFTSLIALQNGVLTNEKNTANFVEIDKSNNTANTTNLETAFANNDSLVFNFIANKLGKNTIQNWVDSIGYGTKKIASNLENFTSNNLLKIKPDEQLGFIKRLYFNQLPFNKTTQAIVKKMLIKKTNANYVLAMQTGNNVEANGSNNEWALGWIEQDKHPLFFVVNCNSANKNAASNIATACLQKLGYSISNK